VTIVDDALADLGVNSWISFTSDLGSGRVVRRHDGACHADAHRHEDGVVLLDRSTPVTTPVELAAVVSAITPFRRAHNPTPT